MTQKLLIIIGLLLLLSNSIFSQIFSDTIIKTGKETGTVKIHGLGLKPSKNLYVFSKQLHNKSVQILPESYDLRSVDGGRFLTSVKNQGEFGTCWTFATMGAVESYWLKSGKNALDLSEQHLATCNGFGGTPDDGGTADMSIAYFSRLAGAVNETDVPYTLPRRAYCVGWKTPAGYVTEARFLPGKNYPSKITDHLLKTEIGENSFDMDLVKQTLIENGALYISLCSEPSAFFNASDNTYYYCGTNSANHAILLVGWDNNKLVTGNGIFRPKNKGAWICRNSWGAEWGENGYFYVSYEDTRALSNIAYFPSAVDYNDKMIVFQYDDLGMEDVTGNSPSDTVQGMVKFTTSDETQINSIGLFLPAENEEVKIEVYRTFDEENLSGLLSSCSKKGTFPGFYTFQLPSSIALPAFSDFYVKVTYYSPETSKPMAIENSSAAIIENNKYWIKRSSTSSWIPVGLNTDFKFDICIKAYGTTNSAIVNRSLEQENNQALGLSNISESTIKLSPNPASEYLTVSGLKGDSNIEIMIINSTGKTMFSVFSSSKTVCIPTAQLKQGLYFVKINGDYQKTSKFLKRNF